MLGLRTGIFVDARDLGHEVLFLHVQGSSMSLSDLLAAAGMSRPRDWRLQVYGAVGFSVSTELVTFGQRSVLSVCVECRLPEPCEGSSDDPVGNALSELGPAGDDSGDSFGSPPGSDEAAGNILVPSQSSNSDLPQHFDARLSFKWKLVSLVHAFPECLPADTSDLQCEVYSLMDDSPSCLRDAFLDSVWARLCSADIFAMDEGASRLSSKQVIQLDVQLPVCSPSTTSIPCFDLERSQCFLPLSDDLLRDFWRFIPFSQLLVPPAGLSDTGRFMHWITQAGLRRSPAPGETLVIPTDGSFAPQACKAAWGLALSVRPSSATCGSGELIGCLWGPLDAFGRYVGDSLGRICGTFMGCLGSFPVAMAWSDDHSLRQRVGALGSRRQVCGS